MEVIGGFNYHYVLKKNFIQKAWKHRLNGKAVGYKGQKHHCETHKDSKEGSYKLSNVGFRCSHRAPRGTDGVEIILATCLSSFLLASELPPCDTGPV